MTAKLSLRLPDHVHAQVQAWAERDGISLNEWLARRSSGKRSAAAWVR